MSSSTYEAYIASPSNETRDVMKMIDDYLTDIPLSMAQNKKIDNITTMFRAKSEHGMVEAAAPIVIEHRADANIDKINEQIKILNAGKSLNNIEIKKLEK